MRRIQGSSYQNPPNFEGPLPGPRPVDRKIPLKNLEVTTKVVEPDYSTNGGYKPMKSVSSRWAAGLVALSDIMMLSHPEKLSLTQAQRLLGYDARLKAAGTQVEIEGGP